MYLAEAVTELRPNCNFLVKEDELIWLDDASLKPSDEEIQDKINEIILREAKENKLKELQDAFTKEVEGLLSPLYHEMISWYIQEKEAKAFKEDPNAKTPFLDNLLEARGLNETKEELADKIINAVNYYSVIYPQKLGKYQKLAKLVNDATTLTDISKIVW
jgi:hypothetical protein